MTLQDNFICSLQEQLQEACKALEWSNAALSAAQLERDNYHAELLKMIKLQEKTLVDRDEAYKEARQYQERMQRAIDGSAAKNAEIAEQQLLAASLENKRLKDILNHIWNDCTRWTGKERANGSCPTDCPPWDSEIDKALSSPDHSAIAGLYLELREKVQEHMHIDGSIIMSELRDILRRIKEQG